MITYLLFIVGDIVGVYNEFSSDDTPIEAGAPRCTFTGFRVAPQ